MNTIWQKRGRQGVLVMTTIVWGSALAATAGMKTAAASDLDAQRELRLAQNQRTESNERTEAADSAERNENKSLDEIMVEATKYRGYNTEGTRGARLNNVQVVDALGPSDIQALPSQNLDEVLKRIPGMQVSYDHGEAQGVVARGSAHVQTTIDGQEIATAGFRNLNLGDVPADLVDRVDVFKTQSAHQIEGGIGATIEVRTKQPFDFEANTFGTSALMGTIDKESGEWQPNGVVAVGRHWNTRLGKVGVSLGLNRQTVEIESDLGLPGTYLNFGSIVDRDRDGVFPGDPNDNVIAPSSMSLLDSHPFRRRTLNMANFQWAPSDDLELRASYGRNTYYDSLQFDQLTIVTPSTNTAANARSFTIAPGTDVLQSASFSNVPLSVTEVISIWRRDVKHAALGGTWTRDRLKVDLSGSFTESFSDQRIGVLGFNAAAPLPSYTFSMSGSDALPDVTQSGLNLLDPANFNLGFYVEVYPYKTSDSDSGRIDFEYELDTVGIKSLQVGYRLAERTVDSDQSLGVAGLSGPVPAGLSRPGFDGEWLAPDPDLMANPADTRSRLGLTGPAPTNSPASHYELLERTSAYYVRALYNVQAGALGIDGDIGVRYVRTRTTGDAFGNLNGTFIPIRNTASYDTTLPMATLRLRPTDRWNIRFAAAKRLGRPTFDDLNPSLSLNSINNTASGGNPGLKAYSATNLDASIDWFISRSSYATFGVFSQDVDGLPQRQNQLETVAGAVFNVSRPYNAGKGEVRGFEAAYNQKFTDLPGRWAGFGFDINYSFSDSEQVNLVTGELIPFEGISKHTSNLNVFYDLDPILMRVGVGHRSPFIVTANMPGAINAPQWRDTHVFVDASAQYRIGNMKLLLNITNITQPIEPFYVGTETTPVNLGRMYPRMQLGVRYDFRRNP